MWDFPPIKEKTSYSSESDVSGGIPSPEKKTRMSTASADTGYSEKKSGMTVSSTHRASRDAYSWMSAELREKENESHSEAGEKEELSLPPTYPLPLVLFVCILSIIGGLVVTIVHYAVLMSGCPLGINGCNSFSPEKAKYGYVFVDALKDHIPVDVVYIATAGVGGLIIAQMTQWLPYHLAFQISGGGTVQALMAVASGERLLLRYAGVRLVASSIYLATGGTLGMDGASIQICTAVTTFCGWSLGMCGVQTQSLLASLGFAAGFAASFNAPLAGIMFAMEELSHVCLNLSRHMICIIVIVSVVATAVSRLFFGNKELFRAEWSGELMQEIGGGSIDKVFGEHMWMLVSVPIAIVCSCIGFVMSKFMRRLRAMIVWAQCKLPFTLLVVLLSTLSASVGAVVYRITDLRGVWGIGYLSLQKAFDSHHEVLDYFVFALGKIIATTMALSWRAPGDLLEPVLIIGAYLGGGLGSVLKELVDDEFGQRIMQPCLVFGMVAFFASCFRFPLTPVLLVLEITGVDTYALVLPAALASFTAVTVSNRLYPPLLEVVMYEDGIDLHTLNEDAVLASGSEGSGAGHAERERDVEEPEPEIEQEGTPIHSETHSHHTANSENNSKKGALGVLSGMALESSMLFLSGPARQISNDSKHSASNYNPHRSSKTMEVPPKGKAMLKPNGSRTPSKNSTTSSIMPSLHQSGAKQLAGDIGITPYTSEAIPPPYGFSAVHSDAVVGI